MKRHLAYIVLFGLYLNFVVVGLLLGAGPSPRGDGLGAVVMALMFLGGMFGFFAGTRDQGRGNFSLLQLVLLTGIALLVGVPGWALYLSGHTLSEWL